MGLTGLFMVLALAGATLVAAHRLDRLVDTLVVIGASLLGGVVFLVAHPGMSLVAEPKVDEVCGLEGEDPGVAAAVPRVSVDEAIELLGQPGVTFVDARPGASYEYAHIPGAMSLPADDAEGVLDMQSLPIPPEGQVIAYCEGGSCEQSDYLGALLAERDVCQEVRVLAGGWQAWILAEGPTVQGATPEGDVAGDAAMSLEAAP